MASVMIIKGLTQEPMEWYSDRMQAEEEWQKDEISGQWHLGGVYLTQQPDGARFEDQEEIEFFGWETAEWLQLAGEQELIYGSFDEDGGNAEYVHIQNGRCVREYRMTEFELDTDEGELPRFEDLEDVADLVDDLLF